MKKTFFVCDSYHTTRIAEAIKTAFPESTVFTDRTKIPTSGLEDVDIFNKIVRSQTEPHADVKDEIPEKIDYFIFSAKLIDDGDIDVADYKNLYGHEGSKVIAVSTLNEYLRKVATKVDIVSDKHTFGIFTEVQKFFANLGEN